MGNTFSISHEGDPRVAFITMGCAKNEVDTEQMQRRLAAAGYALEADPSCADIVVVNTCSFIQSATEESLEAIFDAAELPLVASGNALIVVAGCMPARYGDELANELPEAAAFVPCSREDDIVAVLDGCLGRTSDETAPSKRSANEEPERTFAYVKISDGCDRWCSYCTIPIIRGRYRSFPFEQISAEVNRHIDAGVKEIVLIAQDTGRWGTDLQNPSTLARLMDRLAQDHPDTWFRVMYVQPEGISDELLSVMANRKNVCPYIDMPLQHIDAGILKAMNRSGDRDSIVSLVKHIRQSVPGITLRTTLMAGFPGETDEMFDELCDFVEEDLFDYIGVFAYSQEEGTRAARMDNQIDEEEKLQRAQSLRDIADAVCTPRIAGRIGDTLQVIVEGVEEDGQLFGRAMCQAPEIDGVTYVHNGEIGQIVEVTITDTLVYEMEGE